MRKPHIFLITIFIVFSFLFSQERGLRVVRTPQGNYITAYKGSYALVFGNGRYTSGWDALPGAERDAEEVANCLKRNGFEVILIKNANKSTFLSYLRNFTYKYGQDEDNQLLIYYAGHGHTVPLASGEELGLLVMVNAPLPEEDPEGFDSKSVDMKSIITWALKMKSKHVLFMFDSCFSGTVLNLREKVIPKAISDVMRYPVRQFITAGRADEPVPDRSVFKELFLDVLEGRREELIPDGYLTGEELGLYLKNTVPKFHNFQHPQYGKIRDPRLDKGDFVFVLGSKLDEAEKPIESTKPEVSLEPRYGSLEIYVDIDGAKVYRDGEYEGITQKGYAFIFKKLLVGRHTIRISHENYKDYETQVNIYEDRREKLMPKLEPIGLPVQEKPLPSIGYGYLLISSHPPAEVKIDGKAYGVVPPLLEVKLPEGKHTIRFILSKLKKGKTVEVELTKGERKRIHEKFN